MLLAPIGAALAGAGASAAGAAATLGPLITAASGISGIISATSQSRPKMPSLQPTPPVPDITANQVASTDAILRANQARTKTILSSPLGKNDSSSGMLVKKKLLGN